MTLVESIAHLYPCPEAVFWLNSYTDAQKAWDECHKPQWMFWLIGKCELSEAWSDKRKPLLACSLDCAETVRHIWPGSHRGVIENAVAKLRRWIAGEDNVEDAKNVIRQLSGAYAAVASSAAAAYAAAASYAVAAAYAAAAAAASYASYADSYASYAASYASYAYADSASYGARMKIDKKCAGIVRTHYPVPPSVGGPK